MADDAGGPIRLMNFVSQEELDETKKNRGERVEDGTAQRDRPLFQILKENKDKRDAEFDERFKHRPPKALDEDETEFLDNLELSRKQYEQHIADEEAQQLRSFQAAVEAQSMTVLEGKETPHVPAIQEPKRAGKKNPAAQPLGMLIKVKPQAKKAKVESTPEPQLGANVKRLGELQQRLGQQKTPRSDIEIHQDPLERSETDVTKIGGLVSYSDESDDDY